MTIFITALLILCGISGILALALVLADKYFNNYGPCQVVINDGARGLTVEGGSSLLGVLSAEKIFIPSACGGRGSCGLCKLTIRDGGGPVLPTETPHLTAEEIKNQVRLSCQVKVRQDMRIEIPEELFNIREYHAVVENVQDLTHDIKLLRLAATEPESVNFIPGQYVQLECPPYKMNPAPVYRAYSIASDPVDANHIDLIIRLVPEGICTTWVFDFLNVDEEVKFNGPYGDFKLHDTQRELIFIAGGSGMAPFRSILETMKREQDHRKTRYFFGAKSARDLFYLDEMRQLEKDLPDFQFIPALSEPAPDDNWQGETGLITEVVARHCQDCDNAEAYLCGSPGMIDACIKVLGDKGLAEEFIFYDKFA